MYYSVNNDLSYKYYFNNLENINNLETNIKKNITQLVIKECHDSRFSILKLDEFKNLKSLYISDCCNLEDLMFINFYKLENLEQIAINNCPSINFINNMFKYCHKLIGISISRCNIISINDYDFIDCINLTDLTLNSNNICVIHNDAFKHNIKLEKIILSDNNLYSLPDDIFKYNTQLLFLGLSKCGLKHINKHIFQNNKKLSTLLINQNDLYQLPFIIIYCPHISRVKFNDNKFTEEYTLALRNTFYRLSINYN